MKTVLVVRQSCHRIHQHRNAADDSQPSKISLQALGYNPYLKQPTTFCPFKALTSVSHVSIDSELAGLGDTQPTLIITTFGQLMPR